MRNQLCEFSVGRNQWYRPARDERMRRRFGEIMGGVIGVGRIVRRRPVSGPTVPAATAWRSAFGSMGHVLSLRKLHCFATPLAAGFPAFNGRSTPLQAASLNGRLAKGRFYRTQGFAKS